MSVSTDVVVNVRMAFQSAADARKASEQGLAIVKFVETAQLLSYGRLRSEHRNLINDQISDVRRLEAAYLSMIARVKAAWDALRRGAAGGGGGGGLIVPGAGGGFGFGGGGGGRRLALPGPAGGPVIEAEAIAREVKNGVEKGVENGMKAAGGGKAGPGFFGGADNKLITITSAVITALNVPKMFLEGLTEAIEKGFDGLVEERFTAPGRGFLAAAGRATGAGFLQGFVQDEEQRKKPTALQREKTFEDVQTKRLESEKQLNSILLERTKNERELIDETRARIKAAREEFGLMDAREKQATLEIARKVAAGGVGQLSSEEMKFARQNVAFRGVLAEEAAKGADAAGFAEIVKLLGLDRKIAEAQAKIEADIKQTINVDLDPARLADALEERIAPLVKELEEITINRIRAQMNAQANEAARLRQQGVGI